MLENLLNHMNKLNVDGERDGHWKEYIKVLGLSFMLLHQ